MIKGDETLMSVVIPAYNETGNIEVIYSQLIKELNNLGTYEIVMVNDGSTDDTILKMKQIAKKDSHVRVISFSRNFGKEIATSAGIEAAKAKAIITIDADGQHPPELIKKFVEKWRTGAQIVTGIRLSNQKEGFIKRYGSKIFYKLINSIGKANLRPGSTDYRLIDHHVQKAFVQFTERERILRGLVDWVGFKEDFIEFHAKARISGDAGYDISKLIKLATNSFISLSLAPLYFSGYAGLIITPLALLAGIVIGIEQFALNDPLHWKITGTAMLAILLLFFVGILLVSQGLIALYISHIYKETQNRPLYIVDEQNSIRA